MMTQFMKVQRFFKWKRIARKKTTSESRERDSIDFKMEYYAVAKNELAFHHLQGVFFHTL